MMRLPLSRKIVGLAVLNLTLLAGMALVFAVWQFRLGPESLLLGHAHDRIETIANALITDYAAAPPTSRDEVLAAYGRRYGGAFFLAGPAGNRIAGEPVTFSEEVRQHIHAAAPPPVRPLPPPRREGPSEEFDGERPPPRGRGGRPDDPESRGPGPRIPPQPVFLVITHGPTKYWAGARVPNPFADERRGPRFWIALIRTDSLFNSALFFDWRLWVGVALSVVAVTVLCWLPFLRGLTRDIAELDRVTSQLAHGRFDAKVADTRSDELGSLGAQVNHMAARLQSFMTNQKRFLGDIAHELCAPIARVQFALGILEQKAEDSQRAHVAVLHQEVQEMSALVNELLSFSKAGLSESGVPVGPMDVASVVEKAVAREALSAAKFEVAAAPGLTATANESYVLRALSNVLRNAIRYAGSAGPISIAAALTHAGVIITVADCGPGLPESELEQVFEPFYRPEVARTRETGGAGLGLAIVKTCVEACGGTVRCSNRLPSGLEVRIALRPVLS
jgi:two-component system sensor histidine kinase CpxA